MREVSAILGKEIFLGRCGENKATCVVFNISEWKRVYGDGVLHLLHQRNGDRAPYPCDVTQDGVWCITNADAAVAGRGRAELQYYVGDTLVKSDTYTTVTERALGTASEEPPAPFEGWVEKVLSAGANALESAEAAAKSEAAVAQNAEAAKESEENAKDSEQTASGYLGEAKSAANAAEAARDASITAQAAAEAAKAAAEKARDETKVISGGSGASIDYVDMKVQEAKDDSVSKGGDTMTGDLTISKGIPTVKLTVPGGSSYAEIKKNAGADVDMGVNINDFASSGNYTQLNICHADRALRLRVTENGAATGAYDIYHEGNKPTPADVGAVSKSGDTMTGTLRLQPTDSDGYSLVYKNANATGDYGLQMHDIDEDGNYMGLTLSAKLQKLEIKKKGPGDADYRFPKLYDTDNPPNAYEVGALPVEGGTLTGELKISSDYAKVKMAATASSHTELMKNADSADDYGTILRDTNGDDVAELKLNASEGSLKFAKEGNEYSVYHEGNPPTAEAVGAATTFLYTAIVTTTWKLRSDGTYYYQDVSVDGILESDTPIADVVLGADADANAAYLEAWACVNRISTADGSITLYASEAPGSAMTIQLKVVR